VKVENQVEKEIGNKAHGALFSTLFNTENLQQHSIISPPFPFFFPSFFYGSQKRSNSGSFGSVPMNSGKVACTRAPVGAAARAGAVLIVSAGGAASTGGTDRTTGAVATG